MQWIKVFTDIFSNPKMQLLLKEREGDTFFRVWIQLLTLAGTSELDGKIMLSETTPMSVESLAIITHKSYKKIQNILNKLIHYEMIICEDNIYRIKNWDKYQSADKYLKTLEQNRERQRRFREKNKEDDNVNVTLGNGTEDNKIDKKKIEESKREFSKTKAYMNYDQREYPDDMWDKLIEGVEKFETEFRRIGNNINQLTRWANCGYLKVVSLDEVKKELGKIWNELLDVFNYYKY